MKKIIVFVLVSLIIAITLTVVSLSFMDYTMVFDEAAVAFWGFPFEMIYSAPFYGGFAGSALKEGGREYVLRAVELDTRRKIEWTGVTLNLTCYTSASFVALIAGSSASKAVRNLLNTRRPT